MDLRTTLGALAPDGSPRCASYVNRGGACEIIAPFHQNAAGSSGRIILLYRRPCIVMISTICHAHAASRIPEHVRAWLPSLPSCCKCTVNFQVERSSHDESPRPEWQIVAFQACIINGEQAHGTSLRAQLHHGRASSNKRRN